MSVGPFSVPLNSGKRKFYINKSITVIGSNDLSVLSEANNNVYNNFKIFEMINMLENYLEDDLNISKAQKDENFKIRKASVIDEISKTVNSNSIAVHYKRNSEKDYTFYIAFKNKNNKEQVEVILRASTFNNSVVRHPPTLTKSSVPSGTTLFARKG